MNKVYLCIDLKSFYASVECVERGLDPFTTNLVVADPSRGNGAICLAVSPHLKSIGVKNRCRIFEIPKNIEYITAIPRMKKYIEHSADIYSVYLKYISPDDILVYSIDECFIDATSYLKLYNISARDLAKMIIDDVLATTGICATAGIGSNLFLAKVALDIMAKHADDFIGYLDIDEFKKNIWYHEPITDIWNIGRGIAKRLEKYGAFNLYDVTQIPEEKLYKEFGVNAEFLIDHAHGIEPCTIEEIHNYKSKNHSLFNNQILFEDYKYADALLVMKEMIEINVLDLVDKHLVTNNLSLVIGYSNEHEKYLGVSKKILETTNSYKIINEYFVDLFKQNVNKTKLIRRINISLNNVVDEIYQTHTLFEDPLQQQKEKNLQEAILSIKKKYGKSSIIKGMNLEEGATTVERNGQVGGHRR
mgnify:CR=1 FL=1